MNTENVSTHTQMGLFLRSLFAELEHAGIRYCVLRNYEQLPDATTNDVDLLVEPSGWKSYFAIVQNLAQRCGWRVARVHRRLGFAKIFLIWTGHTAIGERCVIEIDCWGMDCHWRGVPYVSSEAVLGTVQFYNGFRVTTSGAAAAVSFAKEYLQYGWMGRGEKALRNMKNLRTAVLADRATFVQMLSTGLGERLTSGIADRIVIEDWEWFRRNYRWVQFIVLARGLLRRPFGQIRDWVRFVIGHLRDKLARPSGLVVAFCGPDGSGKTTIARALEDQITARMAQAFPVVVYRHGRFGFLPELKTIYNWFGCRLGLPAKSSPSVQEATQMLDDPPFHPLRAAAYLAYYTLDYVLGHLMVMRARALGHIVLFDRYYYDYLIHSTYDRVPQFLLWKLLSLVPQPQLLFYLKGSPEVIHRRKPELRTDQIVAQQAICDLIMKRITSGHVCSTDVTLEETIESVVTKLYDQLERQSLPKLGL